MGAIRDVSMAIMDVDRARRDVPPPEPPALRLFKITAAALIPGSDKRYIYSMTRAVVKKTNAALVDTYEPSDSQTRSRYKGISISELSNAGASYAFGILKTTVPAGFAAVAIPDGTYVVAFPMTMVDGGVLWIIINTQAINGTC